MTIAEIEKMRIDFAVIPINHTDEIEGDFYWWEKGTHRFDIWNGLTENYQID